MPSWITFEMSFTGPVFQTIPYPSLLLPSFITSGDVIAQVQLRDAECCADFHGLGLWLTSMQHTLSLPGSSAVSIMQETALDMRGGSSSPAMLYPIAG